jgi:hypothetical protein
VDLGFPSVMKVGSTLHYPSTPKVGAAATPMARRTRYGDRQGGPKQLTNLPEVVLQSFIVKPVRIYTH